MTTDPRVRRMAMLLKYGTMSPLYDAAWLDREAAEEEAATPKQWLRIMRAARHYLAILDSKEEA